VTARRRPPAGTSYDVRVFSIRTTAGKRGTTYTVRWVVGGRTHPKTFKTRALADSFRAHLLSATRRGEAFDIATGLPASALPSTSTERSWYAFACEYVDAKWQSMAPNSRAGIAETLATMTPLLVEDAPRKPSPTALRAVVYRWVGNSTLRKEAPPEEQASAVRWLQRHTVPLSTLQDTTTVRRILDLLATRLDGRPAAASTFKRKRAVFHNLLEYAVETGLLEANPLLKVKRAVPKTVGVVDPRVLVDRRRAEALLDAVAAQQPNGRRLVAFFACIYYAALRPAEAVNLRLDDLVIPEDESQWGELRLAGSSPPVGRAWSDSGQRHEARQLKHRAVGAVRLVPCHPRLVALLKVHLDEFGTGADGRLFRGIRGGPLSESVYGAAWQSARAKALPPAEAASKMAARPYDLRHACVTTWLNATGDPAQVAAWAGHSVNVLLRVYVQCIAGRDAAARKRIERALQDDDADGD
jgi:integrase